MLTLKFIELGIKKQAQYKLNFVLLCIAVTPIHLIKLLFSWIVVKKFGGFAGWSFWDMSMLYSLLMISYSFAQIFFRQFRCIDNFIVNGGLDKYFIQPVSIVYNLVFSQLNLMEVISQLTPSIIVFIVTCTKIDVEWTSLRILILIISVISGAIIQSCIFCIIGFIAFWTMRSSVFHDIYSTFKDFMNYPISIYSKHIQEILTCFIPLAFVNYYPALYLLNKNHANSFLPFLSPVVALILLTLTIIFARHAYKNYASTGS